MARKNRYVHHAHISSGQFRELVRLFALDLEATKVAILTGLNRNTVNRYFLALRRRIAQACEQAAPWRGTMEVDESYFGPRRVKGKRGRGAGSKTIVFGIFKRNGKVYTEIVPDASKLTLQAILRGASIATASFIRMGGEATTAWSMWVTGSIIGSCMAPTSSRGAAGSTSTALKVSGAQLKPAWRNGGASDLSGSTCTSRNVSSDSIIVTTTCPSFSWRCSNTIR
jgi:hypothetical protein